MFQFPALANILNSMNPIGPPPTPGLRPTTPQLAPQLTDVGSLFAPPPFNGLGASIGPTGSNPNLMGGPPSKYSDSLNAEIYIVNIECVCETNLTDFDGM